MGWYEWIVTALVVLLAGYSLSHYAAGLLFIGGRRAARVFREHPDEALAVLIPARNEGAGTLAAVRSVLDQDHRGQIDVYVLLRDAADNALPHLTAAFDWCRPLPGAATSPPAPIIDPGHDPAAADELGVLYRESHARAIIELAHGPRRSVRVALCGQDAKSAKLNWLLGWLARRPAGAPQPPPWVALLDADHRAHPAWLRSSLCLLREKGARFIQARRGALAASGFFALWDSLHQHVGCELFNTALRRLGLNVCFTGTTAVVATDLLHRHGLRACITEDTDLSYRVLLSGERIVYNPFAGSDEEVSPDLYSFLARRRRWANGHTEAFGRALMGLWRAPLGPAERLHLLLHGCHYLLALPVVALHALLALWAAPLLAGGPLLGALAGSLLLSLLLAGTQRSGRWPARAADLLALLAWTTPLALIAMNLALAALYGDWARAVPPLPGPIQVLGLAGLVAPLVVLLVGLAGYGRLSLGSALAVTLSYPLALYLDVAGVLLGLGDVMARRQLWLVVARAQRAQRAPAAGMHALRAWRAAGLRPWRTLPALLTAGVFCCGLLAAPEQELLVEPTACRALAHDGEPWIVPAARLADYCDPAPDGPARISTRHGRFTLRRADGLATVDPTYWVRQDTTFACNLARFDPGEVLPLAGGGQELRVRRAPALPAPDAAAPPQPGLAAANESSGAEPGTDKPFRAGSLASKDEPAARFTYGRFEVELKAAAGAGLLTAFFLYRFDPWQEIDAEILGQDTTRLLANVYYNPGQKGDRYNYGYRGTPVLLELGFDAASDFHHYAIEWDPEEIRWFVDGRLLHHRPAGRPTPIPHLPMRLYLSAWPICSEELAGRLDERALPASAQVRAVRISSYERAESGWQDLLLGGCAGTPDPGGADWRHGAAWMQPGTAPER